MSNLTKALIYMGFEALTKGFQQSYPQFFWMKIKAL